MNTILRHGIGLLTAILLAGCAADGATGTDPEEESSESVGEAQEAVTFTSLGGGLAPGSGAGAASWGAGRLDVFVRGGNDMLYHRASTDNAATWSGWESLGGTLSSDPAAVSWGPGRIDLVVRGGTQIYHKAYDQSINGWTGWVSLGGTATSGPAIASRGVGILDVFVNGGANLWQRSFSTASGAWTAWAPLGAALSSDPAAVSWGPGRVDIFGRGADNTLQHRAWDQATGWSAWESLGGNCSSGPTVTSDGVGHLDVIVRGGDYLWRKSYRSATGWSDWINLQNNLASDPEAIASGGQLTIFGQGGDGTLVTAQQPLPVGPSQVPQDDVGQFFHQNDGTHPPPAVYGRSGSFPGSCPAGTEKSGELCYSPCNPGYHGVANGCWQICPSGYTDTGAFCTYSDGPLVTSCTWDWWGFKCECPPNYTNTGLSCAANTIAKSEYDRGPGTLPVCDPSLESSAGLCYSRCEAGYTGLGPVCKLDSIDVQNACASLYDSTLASFAMAHGWTTTYGVGGGVKALASVAGETGVVYGKEGHFGCYVQTCGGVTTNVGVNAWGTFGYSTLGFDSVQGTTFIANGGAASLPQVGWNVSGQTATVRNTSGEAIRTLGSVVVGTELWNWDLPFSANQLTCQTWVTQLW